MLDLKFSSGLGLGLGLGRAGLGLGLGLVVCGLDYNTGYYTTALESIEALRACLYGSRAGPLSETAR